MSYRSINLIPDETDLRAVRSDGSDGIPAVYVADMVCVQFDARDAEFAVRYLTKLADEARKLAEQISEAQR